MQPNDTTPQPKPTSPLLVLGAILIGLCLFVMVAGAIGNAISPKVDKPAVIQVKDTATPKATATLRPTQTAKPTETPKATATPGYTDAERAYMATIVKQMETMSPSMKKASELMLDPKGTDAWKVDLALELARWQMTYTEAKALKPSSKFATFHETYIAALANFDGAATDIATGIDNLDAKLVQSGAAKMTEGSRLLKEATALFDKGKM